MEQRYDRVSTIITTNLEPTDWYSLFQNKSLVDALLDRLQHHCVTIRINGPSLRTPESPSKPPAVDEKAARKKNSRALAGSVLLSLPGSAYLSAEAAVQTGQTHRGMGHLFRTAEALRIKQRLQARR
jgi:hypothetical protein